MFILGCSALLVGAVVDATLQCWEGIVAQINLCLISLHIDCHFDCCTAIQSHHQGSGLRVSVEKSAANFAWHALLGRRVWHVSSNSVLSYVHT
jgi:hypothetical protein